MAEFQGKRLEDGEFPVNPGEYSKVEISEVTCWLMKSPVGGPVFHIGPKPPLGGHEVEENPDGTITVQPQPDNSNSILVSWPNGKSWHGYIYNGVWKEV